MMAEMLNLKGVKELTANDSKKINAGRTNEGTIDKCCIRIPTNGLTDLWCTDNPKCRTSWCAC